MWHLRRCCIPLESLAGRVQQLRSHGEVDSRGVEMHMAKIDRQMRKEALNIQPLSVPRSQAMDGEGMA